MPKATTRKITAKPVASKLAAKPSVAAAITATVAKPGNPLSASGTGTSAVPARKPTPEATANATAIVAAAAKPVGRITRTAATIVKQAANFGSLSDRDTAYLGFYRRLASAAPNGVLTLAAIVASGQRPPHIGSNKPHDAGVIERGSKAGLYAVAADGRSFTITKLGTDTKAA